MNFKELGRCAQYLDHTVEQGFGRASAESHESVSWKWPGTTNVVRSKKACGTWTQMHKDIVSSCVVNGALTQRRQIERDWVSNDRCQQCDKDGGEHYRLCECVALELPRDVSSHQEQAVTMLKYLGKILTLKPCAGRSAHERRDNSTKTSGEVRTLPRNVEGTQKSGQVQWRLTARLEERLARTQPLGTEQ